MRLSVVGSTPFFRRLDIIILTDLSLLFNFNNSGGGGNRTRDPSNVRIECIGPSR